MTLCCATRIRCACIASELIHTNLLLTRPEQLLPARLTALSNLEPLIHRRYQTPSLSVRTLTMSDVSSSGNVQTKTLLLLFTLHNSHA